MSLLPKYCLTKILRRLNQIVVVDRQLQIRSAEKSAEDPNEDISIERIKDLIIEAYSKADENRRETLLQRADRLETHLVATYRSKGLEITADNIYRTIEHHRQRCRRR